MGVIESMISSIKDNRKVRGGRKTMRDRWDEYAYENGKALVFNDSMSKEEHHRHQLMWKKRRQRTKLKIGVLFGAFILAIICFLLWIAG